jgi:hypothetical protein
VAVGKPPQRRGGAAAAGRSVGIDQ